MVACGRGRVHVLALDSHKGTNQTFKGLVNIQFGGYRAINDDFGVKVRVAEGNVSQGKIPVIGHHESEPDRVATCRYFRTWWCISIVPSGLVVH